MKTRLRLPDPKKAKRYFARKIAFTTGPIELSRWIKEGQDVHVVDVRRAQDYDKGHIPGAVSLPRERWRRPEALKKHKANVFYCYSQVCHLAAAAALEFADRGYPVMELEGGFETWSAYGLPVEKAGAPRRQARKMPKRTVKAQAEEASPKTSAQGNSTEIVEAAA